MMFPLEKVQHTGTQTDHDAHVSCELVSWGSAFVNCEGEGSLLGVKKVGHYSSLLARIAFSQ